MINDGDPAGYYGALINARLQTFNGTTFDMLRCDADKNLLVGASSPTFKVTTYQAKTVMIADERYEAKVSTFTSGRLTADGNIPDTDFEVIAWSFKNKGGDAEVTGLGGTIYCLEDEPVSSPALPLKINSPTIAVDLIDGDTFYYLVFGKIAE